MKALKDFRYYTRWWCYKIKTSDAAIDGQNILQKFLPNPTYTRSTRRKKFFAFEGFINRTFGQATRVEPGLSKKEVDQMF